MIVVDTNVISYLLIPGPLRSLAEKAARKDVWCAPLLWRSEFLNVLATHMRQKQMPLREARELMTVAESLFWGREFTVRSATVLDCVHGSRRSAYDCEFVALAIDLRITLVTTDEPVVQEFPGTAIHLRDYAV